MSRNHIWQLEFILESLKQNAKVSKEISDRYHSVGDQHEKGIGVGLDISRKNLTPIIEKLDTLLLEMSPYMEEDIEFEDKEYA
jgi:hypothetical protein